MKEIYEKAFKPLLPKQFDGNEWFVIGISIIVAMVVYYITVRNRKLTWSEIICISLLNLQLTTLGDYFFAMPPYDFYDTVDRNSGEITDIFLQNLVYPGTILFFMHFYKGKKPRKWFFILLCMIILGTLEGISVYFFQLFTYKTWKIYYSLIFYFLVMVVNVVFYNRLRMYLDKRAKE
ncbi:hypothetical protein ABES03_02705 [Neobacillus rhizosphaerae]|uniref:hypothetical protein n=1 Tax=Neobacillus rhizosphaerae TaxID=2880965 RepID=UPI003D280A28